MRREDPGLLTGATRFVSDLAPAGALHLVFVRSAEPHGAITEVDASAALALSGVVGVFLAADLRALGARPLPCGWVTEGQRMVAIEPLAEAAVQYAGQPVAAVLATDAYVAEDAVALVHVTVVPRPAVLDAEAALAPDAALLHPDWGTNLVAEIAIGGGDVDAALAASAARIRARTVVGRQAPSPMEGRATVAAPDAATGRLTAWVSTQAAHHARHAIAAACGWNEDRVRVICPAVGGSFGLKEYIYPEDAITCLLAVHTGRPVRWVEDRCENLTAAGHARESIIDLELGADADGRVLAVDGTWLWDVGGHPSSHGLGPARFGAALITGPYAIDHARVLVRGVVTNKAPIGGYRGYGGPQALVAMERALDVLAGTLGLTGAEIRRRNLLGAGDLPCAMPSGVELDTGDYRDAFAEVAAAVDDTLAETTPADGCVVGAGVVPYVMLTAMGPSKGAAGSGLDHGTYETARVAMTHDGAAVVHVGTSSQGQGHATMLAGVAGRTLGLDPQRVRVVAGDTDLTPYSPVSAVGSRGAAVVGGAVRAACAPLAAKLRRQAAHRLGCAVEDVALVDGEARGGGAAITVAALAHDVLMGQELGDGIEPGMDAIATVDPAATGMTYGAHGAVVEVDPALGVVRVLRYVALDDCGPRLEPAIVRGQLIGGIAQGLGAALLEEVRYDADARPLTTGLDAGGYLLPVAATMPALDLRVRETASPALPGGVKGVGEAGIAAPPAVVAQAVDAALGRVAAAVTRIPLTPERVLAGAAAPRPEVVAR